MYTNVGQYVVDAAEKYSHKIAVKDQQNSFSFIDVFEYSKRIGREINRKINTTNRPIVVVTEKSARDIPVMMGIIFSGNYYVPIDIKMPAERMNKIINIVEPELVIVDSHGEQVCDCLKVICEIIKLESFSNNDAIEDTEFSLIKSITDNDPAYMLFTSGSTGTPKGVLVPHRAVIDYIEWEKAHMPIGESSVLANQAPFYFDASMPDIYTPFATGAKLVLIPEHYFMIVPKLIDYLNEEGVNTIIWVPSALVTISLSDKFDYKHIDALNLVMFCGEIMPNKVLNKWRKNYPQTMFVNLYGPTEAAYACTYFIVNREFGDSETLPIGMVCENSKGYILKEDNTLAEPGEEGEFCIGGSCVALGYFKNSQKTKEAFVNNPVNTLWDERIYKTGDMVRCNKNGELEYIGRKDYQIKHMGYRIELGEIESSAYEIDGIERSCALYEANRKRIILFCICKPCISEKEIYKALKAKLPSYMMPGLIVIKESFPLNANGKIDRKKLFDDINK